RGRVRVPVVIVTLACDGGHTAGNGYILRLRSKRPPRMAALLDEIFLSGCAVLSRAQMQHSTTWAQRHFCGGGGVCGCCVCGCCWPPVFSWPFCTSCPS